MKKNPIIFSYSFNEDGSSFKLDENSAAKEIENDGLAWAHIDSENNNSAKWLQKEVGYLDHLVIDALLARETRPRIMEFPQGLLIILRSVNLNKDAEPEDMVSLRIWIDNQRIITIQRRDVKAVYEIAESLDAGKKIKSSGEFLYNLLYQILQKTSPFLYNMNERIDELEDRILTTHDMKFREKILQIRTQSAVFKRYLLPQREVILRLRNTEQNWIDSWAKRHFQENFDQISHLIEEVEEATSRSQILHDELANAMTERLNKSMYKLSMISLIFMPFTFITGLFGMNVEGIPGANSPHAFYICSAVMIIMICIYMIFLKAKTRF